MNRNRIQYLVGIFLCAVMTACGSVPSASSPTAAMQTVKAPPSIPVVTSATMDVPTPFVESAPGHRDRGILNLHDGPFPSSLFGVVNQFSGPYDHGWLMIYAGGVRDPGQTIDSFVRGAIRIQIGPVDSSIGTPSPIEEFDVPGSTKSVKIVAVSGNTVTLQQQDGSPVMFDLSKRAFSD